ncbi:hypothetical protein [Haloarcula nitratireducens]|uniref:DUF8163 domain-containing protein n=1 Tax=Haloarcula nitratireducens TaxID=2487749 RepID=A0AAW4PIL4_9EURY|nr:hypothetical protein [Halomicroarcula nitratireducens]MBX0297799.1 hypothetical protein [Halomicroarcula nitratireducens]
MSEHRRWGTELGWAGALVLLAILAPLWVLSGRLGIAAWFAIAVSWIAFPPIVAVAIGQFALIALTPADIDLLTVLPTEIGLLGLLIVDVGSNHSLREVALLVGSVLALSTFALALTLTNGIVVAMLCSLTVLAVISYLFHRYLLLSLGHLSPSDDT